MKILNFTLTCSFFCHHSKRKHMVYILINFILSHFRHNRSWKFASFLLSIMNFCVENLSRWGNGAVLFFKEYRLHEPWIYLWILSKRINGTPMLSWPWININGVVSLNALMFCALKKCYFLIICSCFNPLNPDINTVHFWCLQIE